MMESPLAKSLNDFEKDLDLIFDGPIAAAEIRRQHQRFIGLVKQAGQSREGLEALAARTPESIARIVAATGKLRTFVMDVPGGHYIADDDEILNEFGLESPSIDVIRAFLKDHARHAVIDAQVSN